MTIINIVTALDGKDKYYLMVDTVFSFKIPYVPVSSSEAAHQFKFYNNIECISLQYRWVLLVIRQEWCVT